jgi:hypothetical protein
MYAPQFVQVPRDYHCEEELGRSYFDARIGPVNDPTLRVIWLKDGQPLPNANRIQVSIQTLSLAFQHFGLFFRIFGQLKFVTKLSHFWERINLMPIERN